jgi:serine/threonine protein kinase
MGRVWHARDELLGRDVAIKEVRFPPGLSEAEKDELRQRMLREARSAAQLSHPAVATVHDVVEDLGRPWIVMELVHGRSLDRVIAKDGPLPPKAIAQIGRQLLDALAAVHAAGVLHRDVKPSNVMLTGDGRAVLTDFGIATIDGDPSLTQAGMIIGTPAFSAPERIRGEVATPAADLWSLGATLYAAVEGQGPYDHHGSAPSIIAAIVTDDPPPPKTAGPLTGAITAFLSRDPATRPSTAAAMHMLEEAADAPAEAPSRQTPGRQTRRARRAVAAALACLAVALSISVWALQHTTARARTLQTSQSLLNPAAPSTPARPDKPIRRKAPTAAHPGHRTAVAAPPVVKASPAHAPASPAQVPTAAHTAPPVPTAPSAPTPTPTGSCTAAWTSNTAYVSGDVVSYGGHQWTANQWNYNEVPGGLAGAWNDNGSC